MARTTTVSGPSAPVKLAMVVPAAIDRKTVPGPAKRRIAGSAFAIICGLTAMTTIAGWKPGSIADAAAIDPGFQPAIVVIAVKPR